MAKGQMKSNKETRKPKAKKEKTIAADKNKSQASAAHPGWEDLKRAFPTRTRFRLT